MLAPVSAVELIVVHPSLHFSAFQREQKSLSYHIAKGILMNPKPTRLLFVCSGNICRSPLAHGWAIHETEIRNLNVESDSAGTLMIEGHPAHDHTVQVCREAGFSIEEHRSKGITQTLVDWAEYILVMETHHASYIRQHFNDCDDKIMLLGSLAGMMSIPDPIGKDLGSYRENRDQIQRSMRVLFSQLFG